MLLNEHLYRENLRTGSVFEGMHTKTLYGASTQFKSNEFIAKIAKDLALHRFVIFGKGLRSEKDTPSMRVLSDTLKSMVGATFMDQGIDAARDQMQKWMFHCLSDHVGEITDIHREHEFSRIQELARGQYGNGNLNFQRSEDNKSGNDKSIVVDLVFNNNHLGSGKSHNVDTAKVKAILNTLKNRNSSV